MEKFKDDGLDTAHALDRERHLVAFCSRKLTAIQARGWSPREKETYAVILALMKWASWIGLQPVLILTDHKALEHWATEQLETPVDLLGGEVAGMKCSRASALKRSMSRAWIMLWLTPQVGGHTLPQSPGRCEHPRQFAG